MAGKAVLAVVCGTLSLVACLLLWRDFVWAALQAPSKSGVPGYVVYRHTSILFGHPLVALRSEPVIKQCKGNTGYAAPSPEVCAASCQLHGACLAFVYHSSDHHEKRAESFAWGNNNLGGCCFLQGYPLGIFTRVTGAELFMASKLYDWMSSNGKYGRAPSQYFTTNSTNPNSTSFFSPVSTPSPPAPPVLTPCATPNLKLAKLRGLLQLTISNTTGAPRNPTPQSANLPRNPTPVAANFTISAPRPPTPVAANLTPVATPSPPAPVTAAPGTFTTAPAPTDANAPVATPSPPAPVTAAPITVAPTPVPTLQQDGCALLPGGGSTVSITQCTPLYVGCCNSYCSPYSITLCQCRGYANASSVSCTNSSYTVGACCSAPSLYAPPSPPPPTPPPPLPVTPAPTFPPGSDNCTLVADGTRSFVDRPRDCGTFYAGCCSSACTSPSTLNDCACQGIRNATNVTSCAGNTLYPLGSCCYTASFTAPPSPPPPSPPLPPPPNVTTTLSPAPSPSSSQADGGLGTGIIVGIVVGATAVLIGVVLAAGAAYMARRRLGPQAVSQTKAPSDLYTEASLAAVAGVVAASKQAPAAEVIAAGKPAQAPVVTSGLNPWGTVRSFTTREIKKATGGFAASALLGEGAFGQVYKATFADGSVMAVKELLRGRRGVTKEEFSAELATIGNVRHRNLVALRGYCTATKAYYLVMDYAPNGNLHAALRDGPRLLTWDQRLAIALGAARGLAYLHNDMSPSILHRDIKSSNILLNASMEPLVADFGLAKLLEDDATHHSTVVRGTYGYVAPEYALYGQVTKMSDVYSFGIVLLELITGRRAVESLPDGTRCNLAEAVARLSDQPHAVVDPRLRGQFPGQIVSDLVKLAISCTAREQSHRPPMSIVLRRLEDLSVRVEADLGVFDEQAASTIWFGTAVGGPLTAGPGSRAGSLASNSTDSWNVNQSSEQGSGAQMHSMDYQMSAMTHGR